MTTKIYAPDSRANGESYIGPHVLTFRDGVAETDAEFSDGALAYMQSQGYGIDQSAPEQAPDKVEQIDSRDHTEPETVGTALRDAAIDPQPGDYLPPVGAGEHDPQGPLVASPTVHGNASKAVVPGVVEEAKETALADATLVGDTSVPDATRDLADDDSGDPGDGEFDPNQHTVDDVNAYLEKVDDAERDRVLAIERDGKNRKTVVGD